MDWVSDKKRKGNRKPVSCCSVKKHIPSMLEARKIRKSLSHQGQECWHKREPLLLRAKRGRSAARCCLQRYSASLAFALSFKGLVIMGRQKSYTVTEMDSCFTRSMRNSNFKNWILKPSVARLKKPQWHKVSLQCPLKQFLEGRWRRTRNYHSANKWTN